jgi:polar amino acid transport system substrate-binding protein
MKKKIRIFLMALMCMAFLTMYVKADAQAKSKTIKTVDDLKGAKIGVQLGTTGDIYSSDYEGDKEGTTVERYNKMADAVQALKQNKIDCVIIDEQPALTVAKDNSDLKILEEEFVSEEYAICIAKGNDELTDKINSALEELKADGTIKSIISNYIGEEKGKHPYKTPEGTKYSGKTLVAATNATFPPYEYYENEKVTGIDIDIITAIGDRLGMKVEIADMEFDAIINSVSSGKADVGIAGITVTKDRLKSINFSNSYAKSKQVIIVKAGKEGNKIGIVEKFKKNFIKDNRWKYITKGLKNTLIIAIFSAILGIILGFLVAFVRVTHDRTGKIKLLNRVCKLYLTVVRGTPMMIQLLIMYYVIFKSVNVDKVLVAVLAFAVNSGAYVAEILRSGIMSVDNGQFEAGRSLGLTYKVTMMSIILPQAVKNVLPALCNEFITLLKETSICGYIGLNDLTRGGDIIRSNTFDAFMPLILVAIIYLFFVQLLTMGVAAMERSLRKNER